MPEEPLQELWFNLNEGPRRALCALCYVDLSIADQVRWLLIDVDTRVRLVRGMFLLTRIGVDCANALAAAHDAISYER